MESTKLKYLNLKKSCTAFISNFMITPKVRSFALASLIAASAEKHVDGPLTQKNKGRNPPLYFFEKAIEGVGLLLETSIKKHGKIAENTRKVLENVSGVYLNLTFGLQDKEILGKVEEILNKRSMTKVTLQVLNQILSQKMVLQNFDLLAKRYTCIFAKYYSAQAEGVSEEEVYSVLTTLTDFYEEDIDKNLLITGEATKLMVVLLQKDEAMVPRLETLFDSKPLLITHTVETVRLGSENDKVRYINGLTLIDYLVNARPKYLPQFREVIP